MPSRGPNFHQNTRTPELTKTMRQVLRSLIPSFAMKLYIDKRRRDMHRGNSLKTAEAVFTEIYANNRWGGRPGEFNSGLGTTETQTVSPYVNTIAAQATIEGFQGLRFVDLGCGDFKVGQWLLPLCSTYVGIDVVGPLVERNQAVFGNERVRFIRRDIATDELPDGDVCFVRQVLQHLSNAQIVAILARLKKYRWVFITEHYPDDEAAVIWNVDKPHGSDIRAYDSSGVYLTRAPFNLPPEELTTVLSIRRRRRHPNVSVSALPRRQRYFHRISA